MVEEGSMTEEETLSRLESNARESDVSIKITAATTVTLLRKLAGAAASEHRLAGPAECGSDFCALSRLKQDGGNHLKNRRRGAE